MKKLFTNDKFFLTMSLCATIGGLLYYLELTVWSEATYTYALPSIFSAICALAIYIAYCKHSKNVMKGMIGALLAARLLEGLQTIGETETNVGKVFAPIYAILLLALFVNHFIVNSNRKSRAGAVVVNQVISILLATINIVWAVLISPECDIHYIIVWILAYPSAYLAVVCVESRLDAYRLDREAAGWTEEKGYPEGYVHKYEKK